MFTLLTISDRSDISRFARGARERRIRDYTPAALMPTLPLLLAGPTSAIVLAHLSAKHHHSTALGIMAFGVALQGMGALVSLMHSSSVLSNLYTIGFPAAADRPSLFLTCIPPALTSWAATSLGEQALHHFPSAVTVPGTEPGTVVGGVALYYVGTTFGLLFWGLALWWFIVAAAANLAVVNELGIGNNLLEGFNVVFTHAALFLASNELLRAFAWPKALTVLNELLGVATLLVWAALVVVCGIGMVTGRLLRDGSEE